MQGPEPTPDEKQVKKAGTQARLRAAPAKTEERKKTRQQEEQASGDSSRPLRLRPELGSTISTHYG